MKLVKSIAVTTALLAGGFALADTLELADGTLLEGDFIGSSNGIIMFNTGEDIEAYPKDEVLGLFFTKGVETREREEEQQQEAQKPVTLTIPTGTRLVIRTSESVDTKRHSVGHRFRSQLESALVVDGITIAAKGTAIYGRVAQANQAKRMAGSSDLTIVFTDIMLNDQLHSMSTQGLTAQGKNEAGRTAGRTARAAALGGLYGGSSSAKKGAKLGLGASLVTSGSSINVPAGTLVETNLASPLTLPHPG